LKPGVNETGGAILSELFAVVSSIPSVLPWAGLCDPFGMKMREPLSKPSMWQPANGPRGFHGWRVRSHDFGWIGKPLKRLGKGRGPVGHLVETRC
jgi:hypothetical protein